MIRIPVQLSMEEIDDLYWQLGSQDGPIDMVLPADVETTNLSIVPLLVQFTATWLRSEKAGRVLIQMGEINSENLIRFIGQDHNYAICVMAWRQGIFANNGHTDLRRDLRDPVKRINSRMRSLSELSGQQLLLTCFDHTSPENGLLSCFYDGNEFVPSEATLDFTLLPALTDVLRLNREMVKSNFIPKQRDLIDIIFELMKNTHEWARTDGNNLPFNPNVRGLFAKIVRRTKMAFIKDYGGNSIYGDYFDDITTNSNSEIYLLEIDVFDSGAGFVEKWEPNNSTLSITERFNIIRKCLIKNNTVALGLDASGKGRGLDRILKILNGIGILFIRTDHLSVYRNLKRSRYVATNNVEDLELFDMRTHTATNITQMPYVSGTVISIIYPLS